MGKLQDRELGITREKQQLLEDDRLCPGGSGGCRDWGLSQAITRMTLPLPLKCRGHRAVPASWASPLVGAGGAGALGGTGSGTAGTWGTLGLPREQPPVSKAQFCSATSKPCSSSLPWREKGKTLYLSLLPLTTKSSAEMHCQLFHHI